MFKEKKKMLDTNITFYKLLNFLSKTNTKGYEICNIVDEDGDSIHDATIEELAGLRGGQIYNSIDAIPEIKEFIEKLQKRVGSSLNIKDDD